MLRIISPNGQRFHQSTIGAFLDLLNVYQNFELSSERREKATFFIVENNEHGVYGGAVLYPQKVWGTTEDVLHDRYEGTFCGAFATYRPQIEECWIGRICFCIEANLAPEALAGVELCENFYQELREALSAFGQSKDIEFLAFSLCSFDTIDPPPYKKWLYLPIWRSDDTSGLTHGILPLKGTKFFPKVPRKSKLKRASENPNGSESSSEKERIQ